MTGHRVELLSPAGSYEAFLAAVNAGADAVYLAGHSFGARAYADNFSDEELQECLRTAHLAGVHIHLAVNTLTREREIQELVRFLEPLVRNGLDGVIVQDLGVIRTIHAHFPALPIHASTQLSVTTADAVRFLAGMGVTRVVPARELSLREICALREEFPVELESFVHGAMCYCYSGKCLFSSFLGGRSGNRGRCAQTCRLPYRILDEAGHPAGPDAGREETYPLSMRDLCAVHLIPELIEAGIDSFKIEGRMKRPEYTAGVTEIYRRYIDLYYRLREEGRQKEWRVSDGDRARLEGMYLRSGLSEGYYHRRNGRELLTISAPGYRGADDALLLALRRSYVHPVRCVRAGMRVHLKAGAPALLELFAESSPDAAVRVFGPPVQEAKTRPLRDEEIRKSLAKCGETVFTAGQIEICRSGDVFLPVSELNALRRQGLERLEEELLRRWEQEADAALSAPAASPARSSSGVYGQNDRLAASGESPARIGSVVYGQLDGPAGSGQYGGGAEAGRKLLIASVLTREQCRSAEGAGADRIADDSQSFLLAGEAALLAFPHVVRISDRAWMEEALERLGRGQYRGALVRNLESLAFLRLHGYTGAILADAPVYVWNRAAREQILAWADACVQPLELSGREIEESFAPPCGVMTVYGRVPLMVTAGCVRRTEQSCRGEEQGFWFLKDRQNTRFPVRTVCRHCYNVIYNSVPLSLHRHMGESLARQSGAFLLGFSTEDGAETAAVTRSFRQMADTGAAGDIPVPAHTGGHYRKGAL